MPRLIDLNASGTVFCVGLGPWMVAPGHHGLPGVVSWPGPLPGSVLGLFLGPVPVDPAIGPFAPFGALFWLRHGASHDTHGFM